MAPRTRFIPAEEVIELDRLEGFPHPRETTRLAGQDAALQRAARAIRAGHPPQAWLITGPPGIGKATLAFGATTKGPEDLAVPESNGDAIKLAAGSHPGLLALKRGFNDQGRPMTVLGVDVVRRLGGFFGMTSGAGGWRVVIVDTADDMNDNAANALLKILEEPPQQSLFLLISHAPARVLPTILSRCRQFAAQRGDILWITAGRDERVELLLYSLALRREVLLPGGRIDFGFLDHQAFQQAADFLANGVAVLDEIHVIHGGQRVGHGVRQLVHLFAADALLLVALDPHSTALYLRTSSFLIFLNISW